MKKKNLKKVIIVIFLLSIILSLFFSFDNNVYELYNNIIDQEEWQKTKNLVDKKTIQTFKANIDTCDGASVMINYKDCKKSDSLIAELHSIKGNLIAKGKINFDEANNDDFTKINFEKKVKINFGDKYYICFRTEVNKKAKIYYYIVNDNNEEGHVVDTVRVSGTLAASILYGEFSILLLIFNFVIITIILFVIVYLYLKIKTNRNKTLRKNKLRY